MFANVRAGPFSRPCLHFLPEIWLDILILVYRVIIKNVFSRTAEQLSGNDIFFSKPWVYPRPYSALKPWVRFPARPHHSFCSGSLHFCSPSLSAAGLAKLLDMMMAFSERNESRNEGKPHERLWSFCPTRPSSSLCGTGSICFNKKKSLLK
jgi:hypothetical protein